MTARVRQRRRPRFHRGLQRAHCLRRRRRRFCGHLIRLTMNRAVPLAAASARWRACAVRWRTGCCDRCLIFRRGEEKKWRGEFFFGEGGGSWAKKTPRRFQKGDFFLRAQILPRFFPPVGAL